MRIESGRITTTRLPGPRSRHTCIAAHTAEPDEPPTSRPSWRISWRAIRNESRSLRLDPAIDEPAIEHVGDEVVADALDLVALDLAGPGEDRALGIDADDLAARHLALDRARDAGDRAAGARGHHDRVELAAALIDDLAAGALLVRERVRRVRVLIEDVRVRDDLACSRRATPMWLSGASHAASVGVRMISAPSASSTTCFSCDIFSGIVMITR